MDDPEFAAALDTVVRDLRAEGAVLPEVRVEPQFLDRGCLLQPVQLPAFVERQESRQVDLARQPVVARTALAVVQRNPGAVARAVAVAGHDRLRHRSPLLVLGRRLRPTAFHLYLGRSS